MKTNTLALATAIAALAVGAGCVDPNTGGGGGTETLWYQDLDGDGFGDKNDDNPVSSVTDPSDGGTYSANKTDCDDDDNAINPDATEDNTVYADSNCDGLPTAAPYAEGDFGPAGGIVFNTDGTTGLEAAPEDQTGLDSWAKWGCFNVEVTGTGTAIGTGAANTLAIADKNCSSAVDLVTSYSLNDHSDWFLPSKDELNALYLQRAVVPNLYTGVDDRPFYWSSSETDALDAQHQGFSDGTQYGEAGKDNVLRVRAVRAF